MADDAAAAAYRRYQQEEYERRILQQIKERPSNIMRIRTFEEARDRWRAADGTSEGITERIDNEAQGVLRKHVLSLNRIRREEVEAMRGQSTAPPIKRWMRNGVNRVALSRVRPRRRSNDAECAICLELLRGDTTRTPCGHEFCAPCLEAAFCKSVTCPMCRADCRAFATERGWAVEARPTRPRPVAFAPRRQRLPPVLPPAASRKDPLRAIKGLERAHRETTRSISTLAASVSDASRRGDVLRKKLSALRRSHAAARVLFAKPLAGPPAVGMVGGG